jgi:hypothetical protein
MNLQDVIKNLPKTSDIIKLIKNKITKKINILENEEKIIESCEKKIKMLLNINLMDKDIINEFDKLITININSMKKQNKIYNKINILIKLKFLKKINFILQNGVEVKFQVKYLKQKMDIELYMKAIHDHSNIKI